MREVGVKDACDFAFQSIPIVEIVDCNLDFFDSVTVDGVRYVQKGAQVIVIKFPKVSIIQRA